MLVIGNPKLDLGADVSPPRTSRLQILALTGGGYRGLFSALLLESLEDKAGRPARELFDLIGGTSIGGIIAAAVARGIPARQIREGIQKFGPQIFDGRAKIAGMRLPFRNRFRQLYSAKYAAEPLRDAIEEILGDDANLPLKQIDVPLVIPAVSQTSAAPVIFRSGGLSRNPSREETLVNAVMATAAAPTYFPPLQSGKHNLIDGGIIANAPDLLAITEAMRRLHTQIEDLHVLSLGTASHDKSSVPESLGKPGIFQWLLTNQLFEVTLTSQEQLAIEQCQTLLADRYFRIDAKPSAKQQAVLGLDEASDTATKTLKILAEQALASAHTTNGQKLDEFLSHNAVHDRSIFD